MKFLNVTLDNVFSNDKINEAKECWNLKIIVENQIFSISERNGSLEISVDNTLILEPKANNSIHIREER